MVVLAVGSVRYGRLPIIVHIVYIAIVLYKESISLLAFSSNKYTVSIYCYRLIVVHSNETNPRLRLSLTGGVETFGILLKICIQTFLPRLNS